MDRRSFLAACSGLTSLAAANRAGKPSQVEIQKLVEQLGSRKCTERESARSALEKMGKAAIPALRKAAKSAKDAEVRRRATWLVAKLEDSPVREQVEQILRSGLSNREKEKKVLQLIPVKTPEWTVVQWLGPYTRPHGRIIILGVPGGRVADYRSLRMRIVFQPLGAELVVAHIIVWMSQPEPALKHR